MRSTHMKEAPKMQAAGMSATALVNVSGDGGRTDTADASENPPSGVVGERHSY